MRPHAVAARVKPRDGFAQLEIAKRMGIVRIALIQRRHGRIPDAGGRREIRFSQFKMNDRDALPLQSLGTLQHFHSQERRNAVNSPRRHESFLFPHGFAAAPSPANRQWEHTPPVAPRQDPDYRHFCNFQKPSFHTFFAFSVKKPSSRGYLPVFSGQVKRIRNRPPLMCHARHTCAGVFSPFSTERNSFSTFWKLFLPHKKRKYFRALRCTFFLVMDFFRQFSTNLLKFSLSLTVT